MAARQSPELVSKLGRLILIALIVTLLIAMMAHDPVGMWHFLEGALTLGGKLLNAVVVLFTGLLSGIFH
jgi:multisubunit Na+/H+ antiporter MnhB subunit